MTVGERRETKKTRFVTSLAASFFVALGLILGAASGVTAQQDYGSNGEASSDEAPAEEAVPETGEELGPGELESVPGEGMVESPDTEPPPTAQPPEEEEDEELHIPGEELFVVLLLLALLGALGIRVFALVKKQEAAQPADVKDKGDG